MKSIYDFDPTFPLSEFRVGLIGSHSVGKTSFANVVGKLLRVPVISEGVRHVASAMGYTSIADIPDKVLFQWKVLQWQIAHEKEYGKFITDRTTLDNAAYFERYCKDKVSSKEYWSYYTAAKNHAKTYTHFIYFPIMWDGSTADGFRDTDTQERKEIDNIIHEFLDDYHVYNKVYIVNTMDIEERTKNVLEYLGLWQLMRELDLYRGSYGR